MVRPRPPARLPLAYGAAAFVAAMSLSTVAFPCPDCTTSRLVRASVFDGDFWTNLLLISTPLLVLGVITALLYRLGIGEM